MQRTRTLLLLTISFVAIVALAACSSDSKSSSSTTTKATTAPASSGSTAKVVVVSATLPKVGKVVVSDQGKTVYTLTDSAGKAVACTGACLSAWPPVMLVAPETASGGGGVKGVATVSVSGGNQVTINGLPVYTFSGDPGQGTANGEGLNSFGGTWHVVKVSGAAAAGTSGGGTTQTTKPDTSTTSSNGY